jgi:hypothetical protein
MNVNFLTKNIELILLYGPRKAGTTLLQNLIDGAPETLVLPGKLKLKYLAENTDQNGLISPNDYLNTGRSLFNKLFPTPDSFSLPGLTRDQTKNKMDVYNYIKELEKLRQRGPKKLSELIRLDLNAFINSLNKKIDFKRVVFKEVGGYPDKIIPFFKEHFPKGNLIGIVREPKFIARSIIRDRRRRNVRLSSLEIITECARTYRVLTYIKEHPNQFDSIAIYEKFTNSTAKEIKRIFNTLKIPFSKKNTFPTTLKKSVIVKTSSKKTTEVFIPTTDWRNDLTLREKITISIYPWIEFLIPKKYNSSHFSYDEFIEQINN